MPSRVTIDASTHLAVYDGAIFADSIEQRRDGSFRAYGAAGKLVGIYKTQRDATRSIPAVQS
jgi:hypothetical protein